MEHCDVRWWVTTAAAVVLACALGCSSSGPDGRTGGAAATGGAGGGAADAGAGTGGAGGGRADAGPTAEEACAHLARVTCEKYNQCLPWYVPVYFGDLETCVTQYTATQCRNRAGMEDSSETPAANEACAVARAAATCAEWFDNDLAVSACLTRPGTRARGAVCGTASQCQTNHCEIQQGAVCGHCGAALAEAGVSCASSEECASNLQCVEGVCGLPRGLGEPCSFDGTCQFEFMCVNSRCAVPAKAGESCATTPCSSRAGLICANGVCEPWQFVGTGERCINAMGRFCGRTGFCQIPAGAIEGTCVRAADAGEACNNSLGPFCLLWASCVSGICKIPDFGMCK